jgi:hypothetical protein
VGANDSCASDKSRSRSSGNSPTDVPTHQLTKVLIDFTDCLPTTQPTDQPTKAPTNQEQRRSLTDPPDKPTDIPANEVPVMYRLVHRQRQTQPTNRPIKAPTDQRKQQTTRILRQTNRHFCQQGIRQWHRLVNRLANATNRPTNQQKAPTNQGKQQIAYGPSDKPTDIPANQ